MTRFRFLIYKNKELIIFIVFFLAHLCLAPVYHYLDQSQTNSTTKINLNPLYLYNLFSASIYFSFIILNKYSRNKLLFIFSYCELLFYCIFLTVIMGADFGIQAVLICMIPALFLFAYTSHSSGIFFSVMAFIVFCSTLFILYWNFGRASTLSSTGYYFVVQRFSKFYVFHNGMMYLISAILLLTFSIHTEHEIGRSKKKFNTLIERLEQMSNHDHLTGLVNRRKINYHLQQCHLRKITENRDYGFTIFDIDGFKQVNDTYGHEAGDLILVNLTRHIRKFIKPDQLLGRWGGEEFVILFNNYNPGILNQLNDIREAISNLETDWKGTPIRVTLTFGVSSSRTAYTIDQIINEADDNLIIGKQAGKNRVISAENNS